MGEPHIIVLPGGGYTEHTPHEAESVVGWLRSLGLAASVFAYPLNTRHPGPLDSLRAEIRRCRAAGADRVGVVGFSAGGHLAGIAALTPTPNDDETVQFAVLGYPITSMEVRICRPARRVLLGPDSSVDLRRSTSLPALVTSTSPPFFLWHTADDQDVPVEDTYLLAAALAAHAVPHAVHVFAHGPHNLGLAEGGGEAAVWPTLAAPWIMERIQGSADGERRVGV